jgi:hypothetical protein
MIVRVLIVVHYEKWLKNMTKWIDRRASEV